jgi:hypothetical protein
VIPQHEGRIEFAEFGDGSGLPIALMHEGLGSIAMWRDFPARLARQTGRKVIAWSRLGYGGSDASDAPSGLDFMHRDAEAAARLFTKLGQDESGSFAQIDPIAELKQVRKRRLDRCRHIPHRDREAEVLGAPAQFIAFNQIKISMSGTIA